MHDTARFEGVRLGSRIVLIIGLLLTPLDTRAQQTSSGHGTVVRPHWPDVVYETQGAMARPGVRAAENYGDAELLARIDTLGLDYTWSVRDGVPHIDFDLWWLQGSGGIVDGVVVGAEDMPADVRIDLVDLHAEVRVDGRRIGDLVLTLDSLVLRPDTEVFPFETVGVTWATVFAEADSAAARDAFERGFTLERLDILRIAFSASEAPGVVEPDARDVPVVVRQPRRRTIFVPDIDIWIGWNVGRDPYRPPPRATRRTWAPRGERVGRTESTDRRRATRGGDRDDSSARATRSSGGSKPSLGDIAGTKGKKDKKDDDDDDRDLLGAAAIGVAAVGALAFAGGTLGVQGSGDTPVGLFAGAIRERWAFLVHAGVNVDVIEKGDQEKMRGGMLWYLRPVGGSIRPGFGAGVRLREVGDTIETDATVDLGVMFDSGPFVAIFSVDVMTGTPRFGIGVNLRSSD